MKTGMELIAKERQEQIEKHGYTDEVVRDNPQWYSNNQLMNVANGLLFTDEQISPMDLIISTGQAKGWNKDYLKYAIQKSYTDRLIIAGALIAAELDRLINQPPANV